MQTLPDECGRGRLDALLAMILLISARADGLLLDAQNTASPPEIDLGNTRARTFIAAAEDGHYRTADSARMLARGIAGADLLITPDGGHAWAKRSHAVEAAAGQQPQPACCCAVAGLEGTQGTRYLLGGESSLLSLLAWLEKKVEFVGRIDIAFIERDCKREGGSHGCDHNA